MFSWLKMGVKDSKQCCITYEEAVKRVTDSELKRLKEAFKKISTVNGLASKQSFIKDVLGDGIPSTISEVIYSACGGTSKGISFRDLLCGLVLVTRGQRDEKYKFLFSLYSNDSGTFIIKDDFCKFLQLCEQGFDSHVVSVLFVDNDSVNSDTFRDWLLKYPDATCLSRWLLTEPCTLSLSNDLETPTFYQTLSGVTHLEENEMIELEKRYWSLKNSSRTGKLDLETLTPLLIPVLPRSVCEGLFGAFDENCDNHIDFKEMTCGISAACRGPAVERQKFCFKVFDLDKDGYLNKKELEHMMETFIRVRNEEEGTMTEDEMKEKCQQLLMSVLEHETDDHLGLSLQEYLIWAVNNSYPQHLLNLFFQICHIVLALRPSSPKEEHDIVVGWLRREEMRGLQPGQFWYLIDINWWRQWLGYTKTDGNIEYGEDAARCLSSKNTLNLLMSDSASNSPNQSPRTVRRQVILNSRPGPIQNNNLVECNSYKVPSLTGEGGKLKKSLLLTQDRDFKIVPSSLWSVLTLWYGSELALPRQVIVPSSNSPVELELYPVNLKILRHVTQNMRHQQANWSGMVGGYGAAALGTTGYAYVNSLTATPKRYLAYIATFSRKATLRQVYQYLCNKLRIKYEDVRLWSFRSENNMFILEDEESTLEELGIMEDDEILLEVRNKDLTWPEEMSCIVTNSQDKNRQGAPEKGATGLNNLGNTCFMNSALQCVSNTHVLTQYFTSKMHLYELNRSNPLGMKGHIALRYADLIHSIWCGNNRTIAPLKLRWTIGKYAPRFNGFQQHDSQELLAFLLDGLHEDLNRVHDKPYLELKDSDGRPDVVVAQEAWENHILRNKSIIVDLFHGQLKSKVTCKVCQHESVRFDPFNYLSLPLPMESYLYFTVTVIRLNGSVPIKYGLRLDKDEKYLTLKSTLSAMCGIPTHLIKLCDIQSALIKNVFLDEHRVKGNQNNHLFAFELPQCCSLLDEEKSSITSNRSQNEKEREASTFTAIQRSTNQYNSHDVSVWSKGVISDDQCDTTGESASSQSTNNTSLLSSVSTSLGSLQYGVEGCVPHSQSAHSSSSGSLANLSDTSTSGFVIALHRKMIRQETYFLSWLKSKPSLFGLPVIVPCNDNTTHQDLYQSVWSQVARLISPLPPSETAVHNHAMDCDDSLGYEFPFTLKAVTREGTCCSLCPWYLFCRGCRIQCSSTEFNINITYLAIDWDPTALHLRYQTCLERVIIEDESVSRTRQLMSEPIGLDHCLESFTREETLSQDEKVYCSKCKTHEVATKKLQIWRLPPILIVHLKRFQFVNEKWIKSQKVVDFPFEDFDPTSFLASVPQETVLRDREMKQEEKEDGEDNRIKVKIKEEKQAMNGVWQNLKECDIKIKNTKEKRRDRLESTSLMRTPVNDAALQDFHQHRLVSGSDPFDLKYNLYAVVCHSGMLGGGHYVSYATNPRNTWYCYNDSSCRQVTRSQMDLSSAYMLFYERRNLSYQQYMPNVTGKTPDVGDIDEDFDTDFKKFCTIQ